MKFNNNYKVFSVTMATCLADYQGHPILNHYFSKARNCEVWEFKPTPEFLKDADEYIKQWKAFKELEGVEIDCSKPVEN